MIGHPDDEDLERWRSSDAVVMRADLDRALGRRTGTPADPDSAVTRRSSDRRGARPPRDSSAASVRPPDREPATTRWSDTAKDSPSSDAELIEAVRDGTVQAYGQLFARHVHAARNLARQLASSPMEADDLVSDAFAKVLTSLCAGGGPESSFRAYLLTALRHTAYDKTKRDRKVELSDDVAAVSGAEQVTSLPFHDTAVAKLNRSLAAKAFASLPERWQTVLWHTEIEGEPPGDVAPLLGLTSNGVSALAYRAREGLRKAYLQAHVVDNPAERCRATAAKLGSWTRDGLSRRETAQVEAHLDKCAACRALAAELADVNGTLRGIVAPLVLGIGATGYLATSKASAAVTIAAGSTTLAPPLLGAAAVTVALTVAIVSGPSTPDPAISPTAIGQPPASSTQATTAAPSGQQTTSSASSAGTAPPASAASSAGAKPSAVAPPSGTTAVTAGAPTLTPTVPGTFAMSTGGPPSRLPITIRNTGSKPAPPTTLTLSLPDDVKVVGPGNNLLGTPLLELNGAAQQTVGCPAGKGTVTCTADQELAPGESVTFVFRLLAGPKATGGTITATTGPALPLRIELPVTITPKK